MSELVGQVRAALAASAKDGSSRPKASLGAMSAPVRPTDGPLRAHVLKPYRSGRDPEVLEPLLRRHATYLDCLRRAGLKVPETELLLLDEHGLLRPVVVQDAIRPGHSFLDRLARADRDQLTALLDLVAHAILGFWSGVAQRPERIGLNASLGNLAIDDQGQVLFVDTFPPLIGYSREEIGALFLRFAESSMTRKIGALLPGRAREVQDPWYSVHGNLGLVIEGALHLRPKDRATLFRWAEAFSNDHLSQADAKTLLVALRRPRPRFSLPKTTRGLGFGLRPHA